MAWHNKFIPEKFVLNIFDINYEKLKEQGITTLFFDLDNTIIPYDKNIVDGKEKELLENLLKDFKVLVISNSKNKRVSNALRLIDIPYVSFAKKPFKTGFKKGLKITNSKPEETCIIGDQIMTDIKGGNKMKFKSQILVYPIKKKSETIYTKINRRIEKYILNRIKKKEKEKYEEVLKPYVERK